MEERDTSAAMSHKLWPHQENGMRLAGKEFSSGAKAVCIVMPTGAGKTRLGGAFCSRHIEKKPDGKVLWLAHREELVTQGYDDLDSWGLSAAVIQANAARPVNPYRPVQVASIQTLLARKIFPDASFVVVDEFHHYADGNTWEAFVSEYRRKGVPLVGLTATPVRADGRGYEGLMDAIVSPIAMKDLIAQGFLTPYDLIEPGRVLRPDQIAQRPVDAYLKHAKGRKAIVFAGNVNAAREFERQFNDAGVCAGMVWGSMSAGERRQILDAYKSGKVTVLTNVGVLTEGFDDRPTSCIIIARAVASLSLYLQMCGRALRISPETGKTNAIIIDLRGSCRLPGFGRPDADRLWTLEGDGLNKKNLERAKERFCIVCKVLLEGDTGNVCDLCGYARPEAVAPEVLNLKLVKYAAKLREPEHVRRAYFEKLRAEGREKGYSPWRAVKKYEAIYQEPPPKEWIFFRPTHSSDS